MQEIKPLKFITIFSILLGVFLLSMTYAISSGAVPIEFRQVVKIVLGKIPVLNNMIDISDIKATQQDIVYLIRLPRVLLAALVGMALATVGTVYQGLLKNPMADPYIIGISSGAALGATVAIVFKLQMYLGNIAIPLIAFIFALGTVLIVYNLASVGGRVPIFNLLLAGIALSSFMNALMSFLMIIHTKELSQVIYWTLGSFSASNWAQIKIAAPLIILGVVILNFFTRDLNIIMFGEETAQNLGMEVEKVKKLILILGSLVIAIAVAVSGTIGFVGLIVPHATRLIVGPNHRVLMPVAGLAGAIFMVLTDTFARTFFSGLEIPVGIITALFGGPFFIYLLRKKKR